MEALPTSSVSLHNETSNLQTSKTISKCKTTETIYIIGENNFSNSKSEGRSMLQKYGVKHTKILPNWPILKIEISILVSTLEFMLSMSVLPTKIYVKSNNSKFVKLMRDMEDYPSNCKPHDRLKELLGRFKSEGTLIQTNRIKSTTNPA